MTVGMINQSLSIEEVAKKESTVRSLYFTTQYCASKTAPTLYVKYDENCDNSVTIEKSDAHGGKQLDIFEGYHDWDGYSRWGKMVSAFHRIWQTKSYSWKGAYKSRIIEVGDHDDENHRVVKLSEIASPKQQKDVIEKLTGELGLPDSVFEIPHLLYPEGNHQVKTASKELKRCYDKSTIDNMPNGIASTDIVYKDTKGKETKVSVLSHTTGTISVKIEGEDANKIPGYRKLLTEKHDCFSGKEFNWYSATENKKEHRSIDLTHKDHYKSSNNTNTTPENNPCYKLILEYLHQGKGTE